MKTQTNDVSRKYQIDVQVGEQEAIIAELQAEELEAVIAPGVSPNHNETFLAGPKHSF